MTVFVTSDLHFNHLRILQYCPHRGGPEADWDRVAKMNELIIRNFNESVCPDDETFFLGDVAMGQIEKAPALISRLNGRKYLVKGNHDKTLCKGRDDNYGHSYADSLFHWVKDYHEEFYATLYDGKKIMICMSHYPMHSWNGMGHGSLMLHGHLHGSKCDITGRIKDVGMDTNNLYPYLMDEVVKQLLKIEVPRSHHD